MLHRMLDVFASTLISYNSQTMNCMTSPVSMPLNILKIHEESQVAFYYCGNLLFVVTYKIFRDVLRTQPNRHNRNFLQQYLAAKRR